MSQSCLNFFFSRKSFLGCSGHTQRTPFPHLAPPACTVVCRRKERPQKLCSSNLNKPREKQASCPPYSRCAGTFARARHFADTIWGRKKECRWPNPTKEGPAACEAIGPSWAQCSIMVKTMHLGSAGTRLRLCLDHLLMCDCRRTIASLSLNSPKTG